MKVWNYVMLSVGLSFLFTLFGIPVDGGMLNYIGLSVAGFTIKTSSMYIAIIAFLSIATGAAITIGLFTKSNTENLIIVPFIVVGITLFLTTFIGIAAASATFPDWIRYIILFLMGLLGTGFAVALYEHFRGTD